jgi:polar amino acid transport system ATP-binding protein
MKRREVGNHDRRPTATKRLVSVQNVRKEYDGLVAVDDVSLDVARGEVVCILGPSGAGKSTLLRCINALEPINAGGIFLHGDLIGYEVRRNKMMPRTRRAVARQRERFGMVFQSFNLFPHRTVLENIIESPIHVKKIKRDTAIAAAEELLDKVGLADKRDAYPRELSGGQQQRVAIARALAMEPEVMLFDEPTSALDAELVGEVLSVMKQLATGGTTMIVVTHEVEFARQAADRLVLMDSGRIIEQGTPDDVLKNPRTDRARDFFAAVTARTEHAPA